MSAPSDEEQREEPVIVVTNEYAHVRVTKVFTRNGERLEVTAPLSGDAIRLDALVLELLAGQTPESISRLLTADRQS